MKTILYVLSFLLLISFSSCRKNSQETSRDSSTASQSRNKIEWMQLNNEWVPVITGFDKLLQDAKNAYTRKDFKESSGKINEANELLLKKAGNHPDAVELKKHSASLQKLSEKIEDSTTTESEVDSVIYRVCDTSGMNCWILQDREDDFWALENEINVHIDSAFVNISQNDSTAGISLSKAKALIELKAQTNSHPKSKKYLVKAGNELHIIMKMIKKEEKILASAIKRPFARSYVSLAMTYYINASLVFEHGTDYVRLGREMKASSICLQKAFKYSGIKIREDEAFTLERAELVGTELENGFGHGQNDIREVLAGLGLLINKLKLILYPANSEDDFLLTQGK
jgi:hypothetical protein